MCGFAGYLSFTDSQKFNAEQILKKMGSALAHRGPDDSGIWQSSSPSGVAFVHRRLSIQDLSPAGKQPMLSKTGRFVIVFNGEIYNHLELRKELGGNAISWRGHSDTETLLQLFEQFGVKSSIQKLVGMFSIAVWDSQDKKLYLLRDRAGEKPLYYGWQNGVFMFASELKALEQHPCFEWEISHTSVNNFLRYSCVRAPNSIYKNIRKLSAGCILEMVISDIPGAEKVTSYWNLSKVIRERQMLRYDDMSDNNFIGTLHNLLRESVEKQLLSDVPIGAFLSGGIDSSLIASIMSSVKGNRIETFSVGFNEREFDESRYASAVARHIGTNHNEIILTPKELLEVVPLISQVYDEPFGDSSQIPTFLLSKITRDRVTVCLSGDGGDELFGGYERYLYASRYWAYIHKCPRFMRKALYNTLASRHGSAAINTFYKLLGNSNNTATFSRKAQKAIKTINSDSVIDFYDLIVSHWLNSSENSAPNDDELPFDQIETSDQVVEYMMYCDFLNYLPDDILVKVDRASMANSLEVRVPMLDYRIVEFSWRIPLNLKVKNGVTKYPLRQILRQYVPDELIDRPKMGFGVPLTDWLRGPLKEWAYELIKPSRLRVEGFLQEEEITQKWIQHQRCDADWSYLLWDVLMFQSWLENYRFKRSNFS